MSNQAPAQEPEAPAKGSAPNHQTAVRHPQPGTPSQSCSAHDLVGWREGERIARDAPEGTEPRPTRIRHGFSNIRSRF